MIMFKTQLKSFSSSCQCHYPVVINFTPDICSKMILSCLVIIIRSNIRKKEMGYLFLLFILKIFKTFVIVVCQVISNYLVE